MKIRGKLIFRCVEAPEFASIIARSLEPDNLSDIKTTIDGDNITVFLSADKIGTVISTVDDYLMNAKIALSISYVVRRN